MIKFLKICFAFCVFFFGASFELFSHKTIQPTKSPLVEDVLFSGDICQDITLTENVSVPCGVDIHFSCVYPVVLDGCGCSITFSDARNSDGTPRPQFIVDSGTEVVLQNITLTKIYTETFDIRPGGKLTIGQHVRFELCENVTIASGMITVLASAGTWNITGICGTHQFNLLPSNPLTTTLLKLDSSSLILQNIEFNGLEFVTYTNDASIVFAGNAAVGVREDTAINFDVEGIENELVLRADQLNLSGTISFFGTVLKNILCMRTVLNEDIQDKPGVRPGNVLVNLLGDPAIFLTSDSNLAQLQCADANISLFLATSNSFIIDQNAVLRGNRIEILNFPIKQMSARFELDVVELSGEGIDPSFVRGAAFDTRMHNKTAFGRLRQKQAEARNQKLYDIAQVPKIERIVRHKKFGPPQEKTGDLQKNRLYSMEREDVKVFSSRARAVSIPKVPYDVIFEDTRIEVANPIQGVHIKVKNAEILNFFNQFGDGALPFTMDMLGQAVLEQSFDDEKNVVLETGIHRINVQGRGNYITVTGNWTFGKDTLLFDEGAELTITVLEDATLTFEEGFSLDVEREASLIFTGLGNVMFPRATIFNLKGERASDVDTRALHVVKSKAHQRCDIIPEPEDIPELGPVVNRSQLIFQESIIATVPIDGDVTVTGVGVLLIDEATLIVASDGLVFAPNVSDDIAIKITGTGKLEILSNGRVSTGLGTTSWDINRSGSIDIFGGILEFNTIAGVLARGFVRDLVCTSGGSLFLRNDGLIILAPNVVQSSARGFEKEFNFSLMPLMIQGSGLIEFIGKEPADNRAFTGRLQIPPFETFEDSAMTFEKLAIFLTQKLRSLQFSTVYRDEDGATRVRTKLGISSAPLNGGDVIIREDIRVVQGVQKVFVVGQTASGQIFEINEAGMRL